MNSLLSPLADRLREQNPKSDLHVLERAFEKASAAHDGQLRKSGDPYITHPVAVAEILADLGLDANTLAAALLHDTVEDTTYSNQELRKDFGEEIAKIFSQFLI